jgi:DNA-binding IclR family transcriptional regulator
VKIADILDLLNDGKWHTLEEIQRRTKIGEDQLKRITLFLKEYDFAVMDAAEKKIRLDEMAQKFLSQRVSA